MKEKSRPNAPLFSRVILITTVFVLFLPLIMMVLSSFITKDANGSFEMTKSYFVAVLEDEALGDALLNSLIVAFTSSFFSTLLGTLAAVGLQKSQFFGKKLLSISSVLSLVFPEIVFALSLLSLFFILHLELSLFTVIVAHITFSIPYVILTVGARAATLESSLDDAATDLGASEWQMIKKIYFPILKPAILSAFFLCFLLSFDDFLITFFVNGVGSDTLPIKLYTSMKTGITPKLNALATLMFLITGISLYFSTKLTNIKNRAF
jgi:spermidine/putrescine transport system permease protein